MDLSFKAGSEIMDTEVDEIILMVVVEWIAANGTKTKHVGWQVDHAKFHRNKIKGHEKLRRDYCLSGRTFQPYVFWQCFCMITWLFFRIADVRYESQ